MKSKKTSVFCLTACMLLSSANTAFSQSNRESVVERKSQRGFLDRASAEAASYTIAAGLAAKYTVQSNNYTVRRGVESYRTGPQWARITRYKAWAEAVWRNPFHGGGGSVSESKVWIENPLSYRVYYKLNGESFYVEPGQTRWHSRRDAVFNVEFDGDFAAGYQRRGYRLTPNSRNYFAQVGNGLDLYRR